ncbi:MAG: gliding motility lipoprotein GldB [Bacteroidia bacterium]|nr:gliding motility lipoprotein GldB [Bacteroidia bacterium]
MRNIFLFIILCFVLLSCKKQDEADKEIASVEVEVSLERFDLIFGNSVPSDLPDLRLRYPFMFSNQFTDSDYASRMTDTLQIELRNEVSKSFEEFPEMADIESLFQHMKYYFKTFREPRLIALTSDVDYRNKVIVTDSITLIALDNYLGSDHRFYDGIQNYLRQNFDRKMIVSDLADSYAKKLIPEPVSRTFLGDMIYHGKLLYFKDRIIPFADDTIKIGYSREQLEWAMANESNIWRYFVENELLFNTDPKLASRFINPAPFSKFNLELDRESPGRLGQYMGWQIVRSYMDNNDVEFKQLFNKNAEEIFNNARFKPRKE